MKPRRYHWWHGLVFYAGVQVGRLALRSLARAATKQNPRRSREDDRDFYRRERLPVFAPPPVAFPIAWGINSASAIAGGLHVLNLPARTKGRSEFLRLQAAAWSLFAAFDAGYFGLRSPINAAVITVMYTAVTIASVNIALRRMKDPYAALSLATTAAWLALANPLGATQAVWNRDPFWKVGPFARPKRSWLKG